MRVEDLQIYPVYRKMGHGQGLDYRHESSLATVVWGVRVLAWSGFEQSECLLEGAKFE